MDGRVDALEEAPVQHRSATTDFVSPWEGLLGCETEAGQLWCEGQEE